MDSGDRGSARVFPQPSRPVKTFSEFPASPPPAPADSADSRPKSGEIKTFRTGPSSLESDPRAAEEVRSAWPLASFVSGCCPDHVSANEDWRMTIVPPLAISAGLWSD